MPLQIIMFRICSKRKLKLTQPRNHVPVWDKSAREDGNSAGPTSFSMRLRIRTSARAARPCNNTAGHSRLRGPASLKPIRGSIGRASRIAAPARSRSAALVNPRIIHEAACDVVSHLAETPEYRSHRERKKIEVLFAHLKRILKLNQLRLRGPCETLSNTIRVQR